jgi:hypothetical protein
MMQCAVSHLKYCLQAFQHQQASLSITAKYLPIILLITAKYLPIVSTNECAASAFVCTAPEVPPPGLPDRVCEEGLPQQWVRWQQQVQRHDACSSSSCTPRDTQISHVVKSLPVIHRTSRTSAVAAGALAAAGAATQCLRVWQQQQQQRQQQLKAT